MLSLLQQKRLDYKPPVPPLLKDLSGTCFRPVGAARHVAPGLAKLFPHLSQLAPQEVVQGHGKPAHKLKVGVLFSGGQAAGGHNVIAGLFDGLKKIHPDSHLVGFLEGIGGLIENRQRELHRAAIDGVRNQGGFDLIGSSRSKIETDEHLRAAARSAQGFDAVVVIGGDDSNTNAAVLAEFFLQQKIATKVIGVPKTIDGDLRSEEIEMSFGFDSACKTYSEMIGNIARDALSSRKYYHFIKLMGRSASHIALECALACHPNLALIGEEGLSLSDIVTQIADLVEERGKEGKEYGVILVPEGLIEFIPEMKGLIGALNRGLAEGRGVEALAEPHQSLFASLPDKIQKQLLLERDPHGNVQVSQIETEQLALELARQELKKRKVKFNALQHFFGYEGRSCMPSNFDANYSYALGLLAALAVRDELTGVILAIRHLAKGVGEWSPMAVPTVGLMHFEMRSGKEKPVIAKALVDLKGPLFQRFVQERGQWRQDAYLMPGPIQFFGDAALVDSIPLSL